MVYQTYHVDANPVKHEQKDKSLLDTTFCEYGSGLAFDPWLLGLSLGIQLQVVRCLQVLRVRLSWRLLGLQDDYSEYGVHVLQGQLGFFSNFRMCSISWSTQSNASLHRMYINWFLWRQFSITKPCPRHSCLGMCNSHVCYQRSDKTWSRLLFNLIQPTCTWTSSVTAITVKFDIHFHTCTPLQCY